MTKKIYCVEVDATVSTFDHIEANSEAEARTIMLEKIKNDEIEFSTEYQGDISNHRITSSAPLK